jgi:dihydropteroate synthase
MFLENKKFSLNCRGKLLEIENPLIMGILNLTPDSFFDGGKNNSVFLALKRVEEIIVQGGAIIDVGAFSTRPNAPFISEEEELNRLSHSLAAIRKEFPEIIISVDTFRSSVARKVVENFEIDIINDISGGTFDDLMTDTIADLNVPYIIMHLQGNLQTMHSLYEYENIVNDIILYFSKRIELLKNKGINDIILDLGFGFSKNIIQNYELLKDLKHFSIFDELLLVGISRKSMIYKLLEINVNEALNGTSVLNTFALLNGANILRVHDVKEAVEAVRLVKYLY